MRVRGPTGLLVLAAALAPGVMTPATEAPVDSFHVGFSRRMFAEVNVNDARAAVKVWAETIAKDRDVPMDPNPSILEDTDTLLRSLREGEVDAVAVTLIEYDRLRREVRFDPIFVTHIAKRITEQYLLLAHQEGPVKRLADLQGRRLLTHQNPRTCLAPLWLDTLLMREGCAPTAGLTGKITQNTKLAKVVLPVFFRQADACLVSRSGFETMTELNPQVGKQLMVVASSPEVVPAVFAFRADYESVFKARVLAGVRDLKRSPAGQQVLTVFHSEDISDQPPSCLGSGLELIATHGRLHGTVASPDPEPAKPAPHTARGPGDTN